MDVSAPVMWAKMELLLPTLNESQLRDIFLDQRQAWWGLRFFVRHPERCEVTALLDLRGHSHLMGDYILPT